jgi:hypothetical protein
MGIAFVLYHTYYKIPNEKKKIEKTRNQPIYKIPNSTNSNSTDTANENLLSSNNSSDFHLIETNIKSAKVKGSKKKDLIRLASSLSTQTGEVIGNLNQDRDKRKNSLISENSKESQTSNKSSNLKNVTTSKIATPTASFKAKIVNSDKKRENKKVVKNAKILENSESTD